LLERSGFDADIVREPVEFVTVVKSTVLIRSALGREHLHGEVTELPPDFAFRFHETLA
jgi:hypothetical protein